MIVVTGAAGFIGTNIIKGLNARGRTDIIAVDDLSNGHKFVNLAQCEIQDYLDFEAFVKFPFKETLEIIFHEGACSVTTEWNGRYMMENNFEYTKRLLHYCNQNSVRLIYASSAAVYGGNQHFEEAALKQVPLNVYGYSKYLFDQYLLAYQKNITTQVVGLRYFNVYGPHEQHKGTMASVAFHFMNQLRETGVVKLFEGCDGYADGEQLRDFISVSDVVKVNLWLMDNPQISGIFNVGTGQARSFNDLARALIALHGSGAIQYIPFPDKLRAAYQSFTQADITRLRQAGYNQEFLSLEEGLGQYFEWMYQSGFTETT